MIHQMETLLIVVEDSQFFRSIFHIELLIFISEHKMKQRWQQSILLITLIASQSLSSFARQIPPPHKHLQSLHQRSQWRQQGPQHFENQPGYKVKHHYVVNSVSFALVLLS